MLQKSSRYRGWVLGFALGVLPASGAYAQPSSAGHETVESRGWQHRRFDAIDVAVTAAGASIVIAATFVWPPSGDARWNGGILFDDGVRDEIRAESRPGRDNARLVGDVLYIGGGLYPIVVDGFVALVVRQDPDLAAQMLLIDLEAYAVAGALLTGSERVFARARPSAEPCSDDSGYEAFCGEPDSASSMISGHTGIVATSAGLLCAHHQYLGLYGSPAADATICGIGIGMAIGTGVARTINDRHYASDVIAGWLVGGSIGYLLPVLRFYGPGPVKTDVARKFTVLPTATQTSAGAQLVGMF